MVYSTHSWFIIDFITMCHAMLLIDVNSAVTHETDLWNRWDKILVVSQLFPKTQRYLLIDLSQPQPWLYNINFIKTSLSTVTILELNRPTTTWEVTVTVTVFRPFWAFEKIKDVPYLGSTDDANGVRPCQTSKNGKMLAIENSYWLVVWNIFIFPYIGSNHPNWLS